MRKLHKRMWRLADVAVRTAGVMLGAGMGVLIFVGVPMVFVVFCQLSGWIEGDLSQAMLTTMATAGGLLAIGVWLLLVSVFLEAILS